MRKSTPKPPAKRGPVMLDATLLEEMRQLSRWSDVPLSKLIARACTLFLASDAHPAKEYRQAKRSQSS
jgi:hypothetical protein